MHCAVLVIQYAKSILRYRIIVDTLLAYFLHCVGTEAVGDNKKAIAILQPITPFLTFVAPPCCGIVIVTILSVYHTLAIYHCISHIALFNANKNDKNIKNSDINAF